MPPLHQTRGPRGARRAGRPPRPARTSPALLETRARRGAGLGASRGSSARRSHTPGRRHLALQRPRAGVPRAGALGGAGAPRSPGGGPAAPHARGGRALHGQVLPSPPTQAPAGVGASRSPHGGSGGAEGSPGGGRGWSGRHNLATPERFGRPARPPADPRLRRREARPAARRPARCAPRAVASRDPGAGRPPGTPSRRRRPLSCPKPACRGARPGAPGGETLARGAAGAPSRRRPSSGARGQSLRSAGAPLSPSGPAGRGPRPARSPAPASRPRFPRRRRRRRFRGSSLNSGPGGEDSLRVRRRWRRPAARRCLTCTARCCGRASASAPTTTGERGAPSGRESLVLFPSRTLCSGTSGEAGAFASWADAEVRGFLPACAPVRTPRGIGSLARRSAPQ